MSFFDDGLLGMASTGSSDSEALSADVCEAHSQI